jgi:hypothetical protein
MLQGTDVSLHDDYGSNVHKEVTVPTTAASYVPTEPVDHGEQLATLLETNCATMRRNMMVWSPHSRSNAQRVPKWHSMDARSVLAQDFYREFKASLKQEQCQAIEAERRTSAALISAKNIELENSCTKLVAANDRCDELDGILWRTATLLATLNLRIRMRRLLASQFKLWRTALAWAKHERQLLKKADDWCDSLRVL